VPTLWRASGSSSTNIMLAAPLHATKLVGLFVASPNNMVSTTMRPSFTSLLRSKLCSALLLHAPVRSMRKTWLFGRCSTPWVVWSGLVSAPISAVARLPWINDHWFTIGIFLCASVCFQLWWYICCVVAYEASCLIYSELHKRMAKAGTTKMKKSTSTYSTLKSTSIRKE